MLRAGGNVAFFFVITVVCYCVGHGTAFVLFAEMLVATSEMASQASQGRCCLCALFMVSLSLH